MTLARYTAWTLLLGAGFALFTGPALAQPKPKPVKDGPAFSKVSEYHDIPRGGIPKDDLKAAKENFAKFAKYFAEVVAHPSVYTVPQEFKLDPPGTVNLSIDGLFKALDPLIMEPVPGNPKVGPDQAAYIREFGAALDAELKTVIETHPELAVRINAARVLAHVCKGGAPAHYATLTALLANANTHTAVKDYLLQAAGNLLGAYDPNWLKTRNHIGQTDDPKPVGALVKVLNECVTNPTLLVTGLPENKIENATPDQLAVMGFVRRQAIRALAQVRFAVVADPDGKLMYPVHTLARVALADPALLPAPGPADAAEAVIGICNMAPGMSKGDRVAPVKYNADAAVEAVTAGLVTFAGPRAADAFDRRLPWRTYSLRLADALRNWRPLFDPDYDVSQPTKADLTRVPPVVEEFFKDVVPNVLAQMEKVDGSGKPVAVPIEGLRGRLLALRNNPKRGKLLLPDVPETSIDFAAPKK